MSKAHVDLNKVDNQHRSKSTIREVLIKSFDKLRMNGNILISLVVDCKESLPRFIGHAGGRAPTEGALGDAGAVAESLVEP
jgi:hypothetical protein